MVKIYIFRYSLCSKYLPISIKVVLFRETIACEWNGLGKFGPGSAELFVNNEIYSLVVLELKYKETI